MSRKLSFLFGDLGVAEEIGLRLALDRDQAVGGDELGFEIWQRGDIGVVLIAVDFLAYDQEMKKRSLAICTAIG